MTGILLSLLGGKVSAVPDPYFEYTTLLLPGNGTNGAQNNTFLDSSSNNFTITRNGNTTQGTFSPFSQTGWGNYFSGSQSISIAATASLQYSGDFTIECWFYKNATGDATTFIQQSGSNYFAMNVNPGTGINIYLNNASANFIITDRVPQPNTWHHIALVRSGSASGNIKCYLDGVASTTTATNTSTLGYNAIGYLGAIGTASGGSFVGYISNFRIASGRAVYTSNFTPPTTPLTRTTGGTNPPQGSETIWLTAQSNRFLDSDGVNTPASSPLTITVNGSPSVQAFSPFNPLLPWSAATYGGSGYFDGNGDYLTIPDDASWDLSSSTGSIELFVYPPVAATGTPGLIGQCPTTANWSIYIYSDGRIAVGIQGLSELATAGGSLIVNSMNHIVITRDSGTSRTRLFVNGILKATGTGTYFNNSSASLHIGYFNGYSFNGYISEVRFCKGSIPTTYQTSSITVGDSIFTPPSAPITTSSQGATSGDVKLLLNFTNAGIYDATSKNDLETVGNAQISTTQSKWGGSSIAFDGTGDYLLTPVNDLTNFGNGSFTVEGWLRINATGSFQVIYSRTLASTSGFGGTWVRVTDTNVLQAAFSSGTSAHDVLLTGTTTLTTGQWYHFAWVRSSNTFYLYLNGSQEATTTSSVTMYASGDRVSVGVQFVTSSAANFLNGYIDDLRISKGIARYTSNFTPTTGPFPTF